MECDVRPTTEEDLFEAPRVIRSCGQPRPRSRTPGLVRMQEYWARQGIANVSEFDLFGIKKLEPKPTGVDHGEDE